MFPRHLTSPYTTDLYTSTTPTSTTNVTSTATTPTYWECLFTTRCGIGWIPGFGFAYLSGVLLWVPLLVIVVFSLPWVRRGGHFHVSPHVTSVSHVLFALANVVSQCAFILNASTCCRRVKIVAAPKETHSTSQIGRRY